jgi:tRNA (adenine22-N1)-methyltransferase
MRVPSAAGTGARGVETAALSLSPRLRAVAEMVPAGARVADVGTDHAQLLAWLVVRERVSAGIGIDVNTGPLAQARRTLAAAGIEGVELRRGDGLAVLRPGEVDVVVLAGMGGARIVRLLEACPAVVDRLRGLVLQPNTDWVLVRRWVAARGFLLAGEAMAEDRGKLYVVLDVRPRPSEGGPSEGGPREGGPSEAVPAWSEDELELGPRLLEERPPAFVAWLRHELRRTERAAARVTAGHRLGSEPDPRLSALHQRAERLRRALDPTR